LREKADRKENRRINRITVNINEHILSTKEFKQDISSIALCDIDDFSLYSERIHVTGGLFGLATIILDELLKTYNLTENTQENITLISLVLDEYIFRCLKDNQNFEIKYLESERFNFSEVISEERQPEFIDFIHDYRRFVNKSLKILIDKNQMQRNSLDLVLSALVALYFKNKSAIPVVEVNAENQDPEYVEKIKQEQEDYVNAVERLEAVKKKIKFVMVKPAILKKRRENIAAFIQVNPALGVKDHVSETDEVPASERPKTTTAGNNQKVDDDENANSAGGAENAAEGIENNENANNEDDGSNNNENNNNVERSNNKNASDDVKDEEAQNEQAAKNNIEDDNNAEENEVVNINNPEENNNAEGNHASGEIDGKGAEGTASASRNNKNNHKVFKIEYYNEAQLFNNAKMKYEPYVIHHQLQEYALIKFAISFRRVIKRNMKIEADLTELITAANNAYKKYTQFVVDSIMTNEVYLKDKIVPIAALPMETKIDEVAVNLENQAHQENPVNADGSNEELQAN